MHRYSVIFALDSVNGFSKDGRLPWPTSESKEDMRMFAETTSYTLENGFPADGALKVVIMGWRTWQSLPVKPLPRRINIVIGRMPDMNSSFTASICDEKTPVLCSTLNDALDMCIGRETYVIGGLEIIRQALKRPQCVDRVIFTRYTKNYNCTQVMDWLLDLGNLIVSKIIYAHSRRVYECDTLSIDEYVYQNRAEIKYLTLMNNIILHGNRAPSRTEITTARAFAKKLKFKLYDSNSGNPILPLFTHRLISWRNVFHELVWFLKGDTNIDYLQRHGIKIWDANTSREFLDKRGLPEYPVGELGPGYGAQWRHFGRDQNPQGGLEVDQIRDVIQSLKTDPFSRRHVVTAWNPCSLNMIALPPCHIMIMFYVEKNDEQENLSLSCSVVMRSADLVLGVPTNVASYALLTHLIAKSCNMRAKKLSLLMTDCHIYTNHIENINESHLAERRTYPFPTISIPDDCDIDDFTHEKLHIEDIKLEGYRHSGMVRFPMAV